MRVTVIILILSICVIAGCAKKEDNEYVGVGEKVTTDEIKDMAQQQTEKATEDDYSIDNAAYAVLSGFPFKEDQCKDLVGRNRKIDG